jgi:hypothetical protein
MCAVIVLRSPALTRLYATKSAQWQHELKLSVSFGCSSTLVTSLYATFSSSCRLPYFLGCVRVARGLKPFRVRSSTSDDCGKKSTYRITATSCGLVEKDGIHFKYSEFVSMLSVAKSTSVLDDVMSRG